MGRLQTPFERQVRQRFAFEVSLSVHCLITPKKMEMKKIACAVLFAAASMSAVMLRSLLLLQHQLAVPLPLLGHWWVPPLLHSLPSTCNKLEKKISERRESFKRWVVGGE